ncbi:MAG: hypothetical protein ACXVAB_08345, partial [Thermodesulfobacteriota bacterium]
LLSLQTGQPQGWQKESLKVGSFKPQFSSKIHGLFLNRSMGASQTMKIINCKMKNGDLPACGRKGKRTERFCNLQSKSLHLATEISSFKAS